MSSPLRPPAQTSVRRDLLAVAAIFILNAYVAFNLFAAEYLDRMDSIEAAFIALTRYISEHGLELGWFPLWYGGIPFQNTYPPLHHAISALWVVCFGVSPAHAYHFTAATFYCLGPVAVYCLVRRLQGGWKTPLAASILYSLFYPTVILTAGVRSWAPSVSDPARLRAMIAFGDTPHVAALSLIPLTLWAMDRALDFTTPFRVFLAALLTASVVLTNWLGATGLTMAIISYLLAISLERFRVRETMLALGIGALAYALAMPWIPPSTIAAIRDNAQLVGGEFPMTREHAYYWLAVGAMVGLAYLALKRMRAGLFFAFASLFSLFSLTFVLAWEKFKIALLPQPGRYHYEVDMAVCLLLASAGPFIFKRVRVRNFGVAIALTSLFLGAYQLRSIRRAARNDARGIDIRNTVEFQQAAWLQKNMPGQRSFITGSTQFWLNAFNDIPQVGGGFAQGIVNPNIPIVHYGVPWVIGDGTTSALWLRIFGASSVVVSGPLGRDAYREAWRDPKKFNGVLREEYRDSDDAIYRVPHDSLALVILPTDVPTRTPINLEDSEPLQALSKRLDDPTRPLATFRWLNTNEARIQTKLTGNELLWVQVSYHAGWHATVDGRDQPIRRDPLGFILIEPGCDGACEVRLLYDGGTEMKLSKLISWLSLAGSALAIAYQIRSVRTRKLQA
ncbi:MAG: hypothetical protein ABIR70_05380 [Bryobacteraceae bacterium]